jgi:hypothetical protein
MQSHLKFGTLGLAAFAAAVGVTESKARPNSFIYIVDTPAISVVAGVQARSSNRIWSAQFSRADVFAVTQIGKTNQANVFQNGVHASEFLLQNGHHNDATMIEIGNYTSVLPIRP